MVWPLGRVTDENPAGTAGAAATTTVLGAIDELPSNDGVAAAAAVVDGTPVATPPPFPPPPGVLLLLASRAATKPGGGAASTKVSRRGIVARKFATEGSLPMGPPPANPAALRRVSLGSKVTAPLRGDRCGCDCPTPLGDFNAVSRPLLLVSNDPTNGTADSWSTTTAAGGLPGAPVTCKGREGAASDPAPRRLRPVAPAVSASDASAPVLLVEAPPFSSAQASSARCTSSAVATMKHTLTGILADLN